MSYNICKLEKMCWPENIFDMTFRIKERIGII